MIPIPIDFLLKETVKLVKFCAEETLQVVNDKIVATTVVKHVKETGDILIEQRDSEILLKAIKLLESDFEKLASMINNQAMSQLHASCDHIRRGLVTIQTSSTELKAPMSQYDFIHANFTNVKEARKEFENAYQLASQTFENENLKFDNKILSLKIILFSFKMLRKDWQPLWNREVIRFIETDKVKKVLKKGKGKKHDSIIEFITLIKEIIGFEYCGEIAVFVENKFQRSTSFLAKQIMQKTCRHQRFVNSVHFVKQFLRFGTQLLRSGSFRKTDYLQFPQKPCKHQSRVLKSIRLSQQYNDDSELHILARQPDLKILTEAVKTVIHERATVDVVNENGSTPLMAATRNGHEENVRLLLQYGANVQHQRENGCTALHDAARWGHVNCILLLLKNGADINAENHRGNTPLYAAAYAENLDCMKALLEKGANINAANNEGYTALHAAAEKGNLACLKLLLDNKATIDQLSGYGTTPLFSAAVNGNLEAVQFLVEAGADINCGQRIDYPLFGAAVEGFVDCVNYLIQSGGNLTQTVETQNGVYQYSVVHAASIGGHLNVLKALAEYGAAMDSPGEHDYSPLMLAVLKSNSVECVEFLLQKTNSNCEIRTKLHNRTLLHLAVEKERPEMVNLLLKHGANPNSVDKDGISPVIIAAWFGNYKCLKILLQAGGDPNLKAKNNLTALHAACKYGHTQCINELLSTISISVNEITNFTGKNYTALDFCIQINSPVCVHLVRNTGGFTAEELEKVSVKRKSLGE